MNNKSAGSLKISIVLLTLFLLWTLLIQWIDVKVTGPYDSTVGFAALNRFVHNLTGVHLSLYTLTDWLSIIPLAFVIGFATLGLVQWIQRKHLLKVDQSVLLLGAFYVVLFAVFLLFETLALNYRPILIDGSLEASYPSSTTLLVLCVMPTAVVELRSRIQNKHLKFCLTHLLSAFIAFMVIARFLSGVHWFTDVVGAVFLGTGLFFGYRAILEQIKP